ncbi:MAG TPA: protein TolQ [Rhizomicrobium sp.]|nr:protein TolQ [Rhizomicrobium sp.]
MNVKRTAAVIAAALAILLTAGTADAQRTPRAAPVSQDAQTQELAPPSAAPAGTVDVQPTAANSGPEVSGISIVNLFLHADWIVKIVFVLLLLASLWSWAIIISKWFAIGALKRRADRFEKVFWSGLSLDELYQQFAQRPDHPFAAVFTSALREWRRAFEGGSPRETLLPGVKDRIDKAMNVTIQRETDSIERQLGFLATVGATAPFVGLFGTVWGIMNSFSSIAARHDTTLAVVAPGIAEALFATAMGLLAAIPAVIFYNKFVNEIGRYTGRLEGFADEFSAILSRQLDEKALR